MSIIKGVITLAKTTYAIRAMEKRMRERGESIMDNVRVRKFKTQKWNQYIVY